MANAVKFDGSNCVLKGPADQNINDMAVFRNGYQCVSCWELSESEIAELILTKRIFLSVWSGQTQPPVFIGGEQEMRSVLADYGVWAKQKQGV